MIKEFLRKLLRIHSPSKELVNDYSNYETCNGCPYYYSEVDICMFGEDHVPDNLEQKCKKEKTNGRND